MQAHGVVCGLRGALAAGGRFVTPAVNYAKLVPYDWPPFGMAPNGPLVP